MDSVALRAHLLPRAPRAGLIRCSFLLRSPQILLPHLGVLVSHSDPSLVSHLSSPFDPVDLLFRLPCEGFKHWFSFLIPQPRVLLWRPPGSPAWDTGIYSLKSQVSTVVLVGPTVPIYPNLQLMPDMTTLAGWVSRGLASP